MISEKVEPSYNTTGGRRRSNTVDSFSHHQAQNSRFSRNQGSCYIILIII